MAAQLSAARDDYATCSTRVIENHMAAAPHPREAPSVGFYHLDHLSVSHRRGSMHAILWEAGADESLRPQLRLEFLRLTGRGIVCIDLKNLIELLLRGGALAVL